MKILLVNPTQKTVYGKPMPQVYPPLGLLYIAAVLEKHNHDVRLLDIDAEHCSLEKISKIIKEYSPDLTGITATTAVIKSAYLIAELSKSILPSVPVIIGGIHATVSPAGVLGNEHVDFVIKGEGEDTIVELIQAIKEKKGLSDIDGLCYKADGRIIQNKGRHLIENLDSLPFPARHLLKNPGAYVPADALQAPVASIITTRGCFGRCTYCQTKNIFGRTIRFRSVKNIIDEIKYCIEKYGTKEFHIADDNFVVNKTRVLSFCEKIDEINKTRKKKLSFVFFNGLRADCVDEELLLALKRIGVISVGYGVESGNQEILDRIKKDIKLDTYRRAYKLSKKIGFETWGFFIIGFPGETKQTVKKTIRFAKELDPDFAKFLILKPFPGSEVFEELNNMGAIFDHNYDLYGVYTKPVHNLPGLSAEQINYWQKRAFREFYLRPRKIIQHILRIRSLNQLKINIKSALFVLNRSK